MKRMIACLLAAVLLVSLLSACGKNSTNPQEGTTTTTENKENVFEKPADYVSVVLVTINPQFKLYLDAASVVLAVEPVNDDAKQVAAKMTQKTGSVKNVVDSLISVANEDGFVKQEVTVNIEVEEVRSEAVDTAVVLEAVKNTVEVQMQQLNVQAEIKTSVAQNALATTTVNDIPTTEKTTEKTMETTASTTTATKTTTATTTKTTTKVTTTTVAPNYTAAKQKNGYWEAKYLNGDTLQSVTLTFVGELSVGLGIGDPLSTMPEEGREEMKPDCELFQGEYYYIGRGDGDEIASVVESGTTVTAKDTAGNTLTLIRISETELKVVAALPAFAVLENVPKGVVFTYHTPED